MNKTICAGILGCLLFNFSDGQDQSGLHGINLSAQSLFTGEPEDMNDDVIHQALGELLSPTGPVVSADGKTIWFTSMIRDINKVLYDYTTTAEEGVAKIFKATLGHDGTISFVE